MFLSFSRLGVLALLGLAPWLAWSAPRTCDEDSFADRGPGGVVSAGRTRRLAPAAGLTAPTEETQWYRRRVLTDGTIAFYLGRERVRDRAVLRRLASIAIPDGWLDVRYPVDTRSAVVMMGYDSRGAERVRYAEPYLQQSLREMFRGMRGLVLSLGRLDSVTSSTLADGSQGFSAERAAAVAYSLVREYPFVLESDSDRVYPSLSDLRLGDLTISRAGYVSFALDGRRYTFKNSSVAKYFREMKEARAREDAPAFQFVSKGGEWSDLTDYMLTRYIRKHLPTSGSVPKDSIVGRTFLRIHATAAAAQELARNGPERRGRSEDEAREASIVAARSSLGYGEGQYMNMADRMIDPALWRAYGEDPGAFRRNLGGYPTRTGEFLRVLGEVLRSQGSY